MGFKISAVIFESADISARAELNVFAAGFLVDANKLGATAKPDCFATDQSGAYFNKYFARNGLKYNQSSLRAKAAGVVSGSHSRSEHDFL